MKPHGFSPDLFVDKSVPKRYKCSLCERVPRDCVESDCECHEAWEVAMFCEACIREFAEAHDNRCPVDDHCEVSWIACGYVRRDILRSEVQCEHCEWKGALRALQQHCEDCPIAAASKLPVAGVCVFDAIGCAELSHESQAAGTHAALLCQYMAKHIDADELRRVNCGMHDFATLSRAKLESLRDENSKLKRNISNLKSSLKSTDALLRDLSAGILLLKAAAQRPATASSVGSGLTNGTPSIVASAAVVEVKRGTVNALDAYRWKHEGGDENMDAIAFEVNNVCFLKGIGVLPAKDTTQIQVKVIRGKNSASVTRLSADPNCEVLTEVREFSLPVKASFSYKFELPFPLLLEKAQRYTVEVFQKNSFGQRSAFVSSTTSVSRVPDSDGLAVEWFSAEHSPNGTDASLGAMPSLFVCSMLQVSRAPLPTPVEYASEGEAASGRMPPLPVSVSWEETYGGSGLPVRMKSAVPIVIARGSVKAESGRWNYSGGAKDALEFYTDSDCVLRGVGVLPGDGLSRVQAKLIRGRNGSFAPQIVASTQSLAIVRKKKSREVCELMFDGVVLLKRAVTYTLELSQKNEAKQVSALLCDGQRVSAKDGITVHWSDAQASANGTDVDEGAIPCLFLLRTDGTGAQRRSEEPMAVASMDALADQIAVHCRCGTRMRFVTGAEAYGHRVSCDGCHNTVAATAWCYHCPRGNEPPHQRGYDLCRRCAQEAATDTLVRGHKAAVVCRGLTSTGARWGYQGSENRDAIAFKSTHAFLLTAVGVYMGGGQTKVRVRVYRGDNDDSGRLVAQSQLAVENWSVAVRTPVRVQLTESLGVEAYQKYTVEIQQQNEEKQNSYFVNGKATSGGVFQSQLPAVGSVQWLDAAVSNNGTDTQSGAVPCLFVEMADAVADERPKRRSTSALSAASRRALGSANPNDGAVADGDFVVKRGLYSAQFDWGYDMPVASGGDALQLKVSADVLLQGVGVFVAKDGGSEVVVKIKTTEGRVLLATAQKTVSHTDVCSTLHPLKIAFPAAFRLEAAKEYVVAVFQRNVASAPSSSITDGLEVVTVNDVTFTFAHSRFSVNGTEVKHGAIPCLYFSALKPKSASHWSLKRLWGSK